VQANQCSCDGECPSDGEVNVCLLQRTFSLQRIEKDVLPIQETCSKLLIDTMGCLRVEAYVGKTLLDLKKPLRLKHKVHWHAFHDHRMPFSETAVDVTTKMGLSRTPDQLRHLGEYAETFRYVPTELDNIPFIMAPNDWAYQMLFPYPTLVRPAPVEDPSGNHVIGRFLRHRYEDRVAQLASIDIPFQSKSDTLVWRGSATGPHELSLCTGQWHNLSRMLLVQKYISTDDDRIDVAFSRRMFKNVPPAWVRDRMDISDQLKHKFIMVVDGNGEPSSMEWVMASNSVPFMAPPVIQTWSLASWLQPWKHYVPLEPDFSDVSSKLDWAISNPEEAERIASEGATFMKEFEDKDREDRIHAAVLATYFDRFRIEDSPVEASLGTERMPIQCD